MAANLNTITIEEATDCLIDYRGKTPPKAEHGIRLVTAKVVKAGQIIEEPAEFIAEDYYNEWMRRGLPQKLDVLLTTEAPLGELAVLRGNEKIALAQRIILLRAKSGLVDPLFLFYALQSDFGQAELRARSSGTTVLGIKQSELRKVCIPIFPLPVQQRIAGILSPYDVLIENSQRRIRILETTASLLFHEWFVNFRFPGHEKVRRVPSALGEIPVAWQARPLGKIATITMGLSPKGATYNEVGDGTPLINGPVEFGERFTKRIKWTSAPTKLCKEGALVVCVRGSTTGKSVKSDGEYCLGRGVCSIESKYQAFVDLLFAMELPTLLAQTGGSTFPSWTGPQLQSHLVLSPPNEVLNGFEKNVRPMSDLIAILSRKIEGLRITRDLLLPRLLSGQVELR